MFMCTQVHTVDRLTNVGTHVVLYMEATELYWVLVHFYFIIICSLTAVYLFEAGSLTSLERILYVSLTGH